MFLRRSRRIRGEKIMVLVGFGWGGDPALRRGVRCGMPSCSQRWEIYQTVQRGI